MGSTEPGTRRARLAADWRCSSTSGQRATEAADVANQATGRRRGTGDEADDVDAGVAGLLSPTSTTFARATCSTACSARLGSCWH